MSPERKHALPNFKDIKHTIILCTFINYNEHYYFYNASYMHGWATHWWAGWPPLGLWPWPEHVQWVSALLDFEIAQLKWIQSAESSSWGHQQAHHLERRVGRKGGRVTVSAIHDWSLQNILEQVFVPTVQCRAYIYMCIHWNIAAYCVFCWSRNL